MATSYYVSKSGLKVDPNSSAGKRLASKGSAKVTLPDAKDNYAVRNSDGSVSLYDGTYGSSSSKSSSSSAYSSYQRALEKAQAEAEAAARARTEAAVDQVAAQQSDIYSTAKSAAQQAYINRERQLVSLPQQLAALGQSGGASESTLLGVNTGYENSRNDIITSRDKAIQENVNQQNQIRSTGDATLADIANQYQSQLAQIALQQSQYEQQRQDQLNDISAQRAYEQQVREWEAAQQAARSSSSGTSTSNFSKYMSLYNATGDERYLDLANQELGIPSSNTYLPSTNAINSGSGGIYISGYGRMTQAEVNQLVQSGAVSAYRNADGTVTYRRN
jgi:hypothetical protein